MLTDIRMDSVASFTQEARLTTDKKVNLIYGLNGTGKSTISNYLYDSNSHRYSQCKKSPNSSDPILVYNQSFIQDNFYISDNLKGIFSLSKENKTAKEKIDKATSKLSELEKKHQLKTDEKKEVVNEFKKNKERAVNEVWKIKSEYTGGDRVLEYCLDGLKGQKEKLFDYLQSIDKTIKQPEKSIQDIWKEVEALKGNSAVKQSTLPILTFSPQNIETNEIFNKAIVGNSDSQVSEIIDKLNNADWVKEGLQFLPDHIDEKGDPCPFCQEMTITSKLIDSVKDYFDDTYQQEIDKLEKFEKEYIAAKDSLFDIDNYINNPFAQNRTKVLTEKHKALIDTLQYNISCIKDKIKYPKQPKTLKSSIAALSILNKEIKSINREIEEYNTRLENRDSSLQSLKKAFWSVMRWQYDQTISRYQSDKSTAEHKLIRLDEELQSINSEISFTNNEIAAAQKDTVNIDEAIDAINNGLLELGIDGFYIQKHSENLYRIVRSGDSEDVFHTLSEGEKMMISFLYFCELCKGKSSASDTHTKRIAVIDDPISSLSHIFIFNVGQLIKSIFFNSDRFSQVYVLTHSLYFFYELTDTNHDRRKRNQKLFRISKSSSGSNIEEMKYEEIQNDYQSYWSVINDSSQPPALIANCMRNIVEYFFNFVQKKDLNNVFQLPQLQEVKYQAFCRYVNRESHSLGQNIIDMKEFDYHIFKEGLELVFEKTGYQEHFKAMSKV